ncbi:MAG: hypothetical protein AVDCRST_MAG89-4470, partial [uncultured Gemmatimonadetes bacterium]
PHYWPPIPSGTPAIRSSSRQRILPINTWTSYSSKAAHGGGSPGSGWRHNFEGPGTCESLVFQLPVLAGCTLRPPTGSLSWPTSMVTRSSTPPWPWSPGAQCNCSSP